MKQLFLFFTLFIGFAASSQSVMKIQNNSSINLEFNMYYYNASSCSYTSNILYVIPPNSTFVATAPPGEEFVFAEIMPFPYCTPGFGAFVSTPSVCNSSCPPVGPNFYIGTNGGCAGGLPNINVKWTDCGAPGEGYLTIIDF